MYEQIYVSKKKVVGEEIARDPENNLIKLFKEIVKANSELLKEDAIDLTDGDIEIIIKFYVR